MNYPAQNYQRYATDFMMEHPQSAVFLDMGLGKTVATLTAVDRLLFDTFEVHSVLVIAPLRVARDTWPTEIRKWDHLRDLRFSVAVGSEKERLEALRTDADIHIINRETLQWLIEKSGIAFRWDMVVVDELSGFKNHQTRRFKALMAVRPSVRRIVGLTGTPAPGSLMDLWAEFKVLDMGERLGRFITAYRRTYFKAEGRGNIVYRYVPLPRADEAIHSRIADITVSMRSRDFLRMPDLVNCEAVAYMNEEESKTYDHLADSYVADIRGADITAANAAVLCGKLLQLANGAIYADDGTPVILHDRKLDVLEDLIEQSNGNPILVAFWFKHDLDRIRTRLDSLGIRYKAIDSSESIRDWNEGKVPVGLIHPASAGHGLNLQSGGSHLVWFGLTWSLELYQQTVGRLWRQGQKDRTVVIHHIITDGTIDRRVMKALVEKDRTQAALIEAVRAQLVRQS